MRFIGWIIIYIYTGVFDFGLQIEYSGEERGLTNIPIILSWKLLDIYEKCQNLILRLLL